MENNIYNAIVVGDLHIKDRSFKPHNKDYDNWQEKMFKHTFHKIYDIIKEHNITKLVISGDMFDAPPKHSALSLADYFFTNLPTSIKEKILLDGNHEILAGVNDKLYYNDVMKGFFRERYNVDVKSYEVDVSKNILYCSHQHIEKLEKLKSSYKIIYSHFRSGINRVAVDEIDVAAINVKTKMCIAGDIHSRLIYKGNIIYTGAPIDTHFEHHNPAENSCPSVLLVNEATLDWQWETTLKKEFRKKKVVFDNVGDFFMDIERLEAESQKHNTFFKIIVQDKKFNLKQITPSLYQNFARIQLEVTDVLEVRQNQQIIDKINENLSAKSISDNLLDFILSNNDRKEWENEVKSTYAKYERGNI